MEWMPKNLYLSHGLIKSSQYDAFENGCQQTARKLVEWLDKNNMIAIKRENTLGELGLLVTMEMWQQLRKDVGAQVLSL